MWRKLLFCIPQALKQMLWTLCFILTRVKWSHQWTSLLKDALDVFLLHAAILVTPTL